MHKCMHMNEWGRFAFSIQKDKNSFGLSNHLNIDPDLDDSTTRMSSIFVIIKAVEGSFVIIKMVR